MNRREFFLKGLLGVMALPVIGSIARAQNSVEQTPATPTPDPSGEARQRWDSLTPEQQQKIKERWARFKDLPPQKRRRLLKAWRRFQQLPPERRQQLRQKWQRFQQLPPERRDVLRQRFRKWQTLPPEKRQQLRQRYRRIQRRGGQTARHRHLKRLRRQNQ